MTRVARLSAGSLGLAASGWIALLATWLPAGFILRPISLAAFLVWCPGAALMQRWTAGDRLERGVVTVAMSIGLTAIVAESQAYGGFWDPRGTVAILAFVTTLGVVFGGQHVGGEGE